jgi:predicted nucleic acid-binding protein
MKRVIASAEFVNLVPAHKRYITKGGEGTTVSIAIKRAVDEIFADERLKRKRIVFPINIVIQDPKEFEE